MNIPVIEHIAQNILTTVKTITTANGYNFTLIAERRSRAGEKQIHLNTVIVQEDPKPEAPKVYNTYEWLVPFAIATYVIPPEENSTAIDTYLNLIKADVEKAIMADRYRGGYALDTEVQPSKAYVHEGLEYYLIEVNIEVRYRTYDLNPYVQA